MGPEGESTGEPRDETDAIREPHETIETPEQESHAPLDAVMVFGIGPIQPQGMVGHEGKGHKYQLVPEAKLNAIAAATLYLEGKTRKIIFSGGATGKMELKNEAGEAVEPHPYPRSEGQMMARYVMDKFGIPEDAIVVEDKAANTIENIARSLTPIDQKPGEFKNGIGYIGSVHHEARIRKMVKLFGLEGPTMSSAEVLDQSRARAEAGAPENERVHRNLAHYRKYLEATLDPDKNPTYRKRLVEEERWSHGLDKTPSYFLPQLRFIENEGRLKSILKAEKLAEYLKQHGIDDIDLADAAELRGILAGISREIPDETWAQMPSELPKWRHDETK
ncbi:MAG: YdcF family protein [bacterium]